MRMFNSKISMVNKFVNDPEINLYEVNLIKFDVLRAWWIISKRGIH